MPKRKLPREPRRCRFPGCLTWVAYVWCADHKPKSKRKPKENPGPVGGRRIPKDERHPWEGR